MEPEPLVEERLRKIPEASQFYLGFAKMFQKCFVTHKQFYQNLKGMQHIG